MGKQGRWDVLSFLLRLVRLVKREKPEIIHSYLPVANLITGVLKPFFPSAKVVWGVRASNMELSRYDWLSRVVFRAQCFLSNLVDLIIVNSQAGFDYHRKHGFPPDKMVIIRNGIDISRFKPDREARAEIRGNWGVGKHERLIGIVGRYDPMKDHPTFLQAAAWLVQNQSDVRFVCVGNGPDSYKYELYALSRELGLEHYVIWAGNGVDMPKIYNAFDIVSSSSAFGEGFPNVIGEAMACGIPCVVTDVGDSALVVGDTGIVVPPKNPQPLAEGWMAMLGRLDHEGEELASKVRTRVVDNFCSELLIERITGALAALLNKTVHG